MKLLLWILRYSVTLQQRWIKKLETREWRNQVIKDNERQEPSEFDSNW